VVVLVAHPGGVGKISGGGRLASARAKGSGGERPNDADIINPTDDKSCRYFLPGLSSPWEAPFAFASSVVQVLSLKRSRAV